MTIYQEEMQRKAQRYGCITDYDEADQLLLISHKGVHLTAVNPEGFMFYNSKELTDPESREVFSHLVDDAETVREYVGLYESSPQMKPKDVQNYRKLSEYGDVVFAGMYSQKHGFMFCSWRQSDGDKYLAHGDNSPDYLSSKENLFTLVEDAEDHEDVGKHFVEHDPEYSVSETIEDFVNYDLLGEHIADELNGLFVSSGFVCMESGYAALR